MDGKKKTIQAKALVGFLTGFFLFCLVAILFNDSGELAPAHVKPIAVTDVVSASKPIKFKPLGVVAETPEKPQAPTKTRPRTIQQESFVGLERKDRMDVLTIPPGTLVKARLTTGASNGAVRASLSESVRSDGEVMLPSGALLLGTGTSTEERLHIRFSQAVFANGKAVKIAALACDGSDLTVGLKGSKVGHEALKLLAGIGLNFAGGVSEGLQESDVQGGVEVKKPTMKNALLNGASVASLDYARQTMSELRSRQPIIEVPSGTEICVLFQGGEDG
jgi:hypothetical protein